MRLLSWILKGPPVVTRAGCWLLNEVVVQLGLLSGELDTIAATPLLIPGGPAAYLQEVLKRWLNHALPFPTLTKLCGALRSHAVDQSRTALELEQQYQTRETGLSAIQATCR